MQVATGTYTGTGSDQGITGVGFMPVFVITRNQSTPSRATACKTSAMGGNISIGWDQASGNFRLGGVTDTGIRSLDSDGFTVRSDLAANSSGATYHFMAFGADAAVIFNHSFVGDDVDGRQFTGLGFQPDILLGSRSTPSGRHWGWWFQSLGGDATLLVPSDSGPDTDRFQAALSTGYEVGAINNFLSTSHYTTGLKITSGNVAQASYIGNGTSQSITGLGFTPKIVFIRKSTFPNQRTIYRQDSDTVTYKIGTSDVASGITSLDANGFSVGSAAEANASGGTYHYLAFGNPVLGEQIDPLELEGAILGECFDAPTGARSISSGLPFDVRGGFGISQMLPAEMLRRISFMPELPMEPNATTLVVGRQLLPLETLVRSAVLQTTMPIEWDGTSPVAMGARLPIEMLERLALAGQLPVTFVSGVTITDGLPVDSMMGVSINNLLQVDFVGTFRVKLAPNLEVEFLAGTNAPPILPVDSTGTTILSASPNMPIESVLSLMVSQILPAEFVGADQALLLVFNIREPFTEGAEFPLQFVVVPVAVTSQALPITFNITTIIGNTLDLSFRILPDKLVTLFDADIQWPFGRADKV